MGENKETRGSFRYVQLPSFLIGFYSILDQISEAPEEVYDHRTLYEKLQEQKMKKEADYEEAHKLKNMIRGLDDDEAGFLEYIDKSKMESEQKKKEEEQAAIAEFKKTISQFSVEEKEKKIQEFKKTLWSRSRNTENHKKGSGEDGTSSSKRSQAALLAGAVKRKSNVLENSQSENPSKKPSNSDPKSVETIKCIGILPGIGVYGSDSSDSENSSDSEGGLCDDLEGSTLISRIQRTNNDSKKQQ